MARYAKFFSVGGGGGGTNNLQLPVGTVLDTTLRQVQDGLGTGSSLYLSTGGLRVGTTAASAMYWDDVNSRLGIGTNAPIAPLNVYNSSASVSNLLLLEQDTSATIGQIINYRKNGSVNLTSGTEIGRLAFGGYFNSTYSPPSQTCSAIYGYYGGTGTDRVGGLRLVTWNGGGLTTRLQVAPDGKIGIGTTIATAKLQILGEGSTSATTSLLVQNSLGNQLGAVNDDGKWMIGTGTPLFQLDVVNDIRARGSLYFGTAGSYLYGDTNNIRLYDKNNFIILQSFPSGVGGSETYLQSSSGNKYIRLNDSGITLEWFNSNSSNGTQKPFNIIRGFFGNITATDKTVLNITTPFFSNLTNATTLTGILIDINDTTTYTGFTTVRAIQSLRGGAYFNTTTPQASSVLQADSTTQGFLPPRMTTAQKNAIASPANGLMVYDTDLVRPCFFNGATWITL